MDKHYWEGSNCHVSCSLNEKTSCQHDSRELFFVILLLAVNKTKHQPILSFTTCSIFSWNSYCLILSAAIWKRNNIEAAGGLWQASEISKTTITKEKTTKKKSKNKMKEM
jgi:hypothetical protein